MYEVNKIIFYFFIYAFFGWIIEFLYKSIKFKKIVNPGFLTGPFVPVYGIGALLILVFDYYLKFYIPFWGRLIIYSIMLNILEYYTGALLEEIFHIKLWDYSNMFLNIKGRICLLHTIYWVLLSCLLILFIEPFIFKMGKSINDKYLIIINNFLISYLVIDLLYSIKLMNNLILFIKKIKKNFLNIKKSNFKITYLSNKRLFDSFPILKDYFLINIKKNINYIFLKLHILKDNKMNQFKLNDKENDEFYNISKDILNHEKFLELKNYKHHDKSIYEHVISVARISYKIGKLFKLEIKSLVRGALLHDFFFYDWRLNKPVFDNKKKLHAFYHARHAYENAIKYFKLNKIEKDIILKHMFPLTSGLPKYKETIVVLIVDKIVASKELLIGITNNKILREKKSA